MIGVDITTSGSNDGQSYVFMSLYLYLAAVTERINSINRIMAQQSPVHDAYTVP